MTTAQRHSGGRLSKGARQPILSRVLDPVAEAVRVEADTRGMSVSDYVAAILAREVGLPEHAPALSPALPAIQELPISAA